MVICLERDADLRMAQLMPVPLTVSCFSKIQIGFIFLVLARPGSPGQRALKRGVFVCMLCSYADHWITLPLPYVEGNEALQQPTCQMRNKAVIDRRLHPLCCQLELL